MMTATYEELMKENLELRGMIFMTDDDKLRKYKMINTRQEFRIHLENLLRDVCRSVAYIRIDWDKTDTEYMTAAKTVTICYDNSYEKEVNVECCSFRAIATEVLRAV